MNTKQFKIWIDLIDSAQPLSISTLADRHNYTNREVTTAIGRMPSPPIILEEGYARFVGEDDDREYYRRVLTAERFGISDDLCNTVFTVLDDEWRTVTAIATRLELPPVLVSRTLVVMGDRIERKLSAGGVFYKVNSVQIPEA